MAEDRLRRQLLSDVIDQGTGDRSSVEVDELPAELVRERRVTTHLLLGCVLQLLGPDEYHRELRVVRSRVGVSAPNTALEVSAGIARTIRPRTSQGVWTPLSLM